MDFLEFGKGETLELNMLYRDYLKIPIDLTGHTVTFSIWAENATAPLATQAATVDSEGHISVTIDASVTDTWPIANYVMLIEDISGSGNVKWLVRMRVSVVGESTVVNQ